MSQPFPEAPQILTHNDFLDEMARHRETREPGNTIRLARAEADHLINDLQAQGIHQPDGEPAPEINTGDRLYGIQIEIPPKGTTWHRWGNATIEESTA